MTERLSEKKYPAYARYKSRTPALLPFPRQNSVRKLMNLRYKTTSITTEFAYSLIF